jgi:glycosyltransferase involved in cell wall biosynthesis
MLEKVNPQAMITLGDYQNVTQIATSAMRFNIPWITWFPVDFSKWDLEVTRFFYSLDANLVMMSRFGERLAKEAMIEPLATIPHGVDTEIYKPMDKQKARIAIGLPESMLDRFTVGFVGQNVERKRIDKLVDAFAMFSEGKSNVLLLAHTDPSLVHDKNPGLVLNDYIADYGLDAKYLHTHPLLYHMKYDDRTMATLYNAFDVLVLTSAGEGFGVPIIEAAACGVPTIGTDCTSMTELIEGHGWLADVKTTYNYKGFVRSIVDEKSVARCLQECYDDPKKTHEMGEKALEFSKEYDVKIIQNKWVKLLQKE